MKVYLVVEHGWEYTEIYGVYDSRELAEMRIASYGDNSGVEIEEREMFLEKLKENNIEYDETNI